MLLFYSRIKEACDFSYNLFDNYVLSLYSLIVFNDAFYLANYFFCYKQTKLLRSSFLYYSLIDFLLLY